jgi:hypothetical protein
MKLPFSIDEFLNVFRNYNESVWPTQFVLYLLSLIAILLLVKKNSGSSRIVNSILALFWIWMGVVYHILFFSSINKAAYLFGAVFIIQGLLFLYVGVVKQKIRLEFKLDLSGVVALIFISYALILYPMIGHAMGRIYPQSPTFGVPCPTTIFTFGIFLYSVNRIQWYVITIPLLWSVVGFFAALNLSVKEDFGLVIAGLLSAAILFFYKPKRQTKI